MKNLQLIKIRRIVASFLAINILFESIAPTCAWALTGGPSQPEVEAFTPVSTSGMVDPFTGDFAYNIPLLDVDGYPINLAYSGGVTMDQESSWVGLGWNINPGVINRTMRGLPDDFNGENVVRELKMKENITWGVSLGAGIEFAGIQKKKLPSGGTQNKKDLGLNFSLGMKYNNYTGYGIEQSFTPSLSCGVSGKFPQTYSLGINSSSDEGLSLEPSIGMSTSIKKGMYKDNSLSLKVGTSYNSRAGLKSLTINASQSKTGNSILKKGKNDGNSISGEIASSSFNFGMPTYTPQAGLPMQNFSISGSFKLGLSAYALDPSFDIKGYYSAQKLSTNTISNPAYGYMNADEGTKYNNSLMDFNRENDGVFTPSTPALAIPNFTYDVYSVMGQGASGSYRPFRSDIGYVYDPNVKTTSDGGSIGVEVGTGTVFKIGVDLTVTHVEGEVGRWNNESKVKNKATTALQHKVSSNNPLYEKYYFKEANEKTVDSDPSYYQKMNGTGAASVYLNTLSKWNIQADKYFTSSPTSFSIGNEIKEDNTRQKRDRRNMPISTLSRAELKSLAIDDLESKLNKMGINPEDAKPYHIGEITSLQSGGERYVYGLAAYNKSQEEVTFAVGNNSQGYGLRTADENTGLVKYAVGDNEVTGNTCGRDNYFSNTKMPAYAHSYLLTAVLSPDYVDSDGFRGPSKGDIGQYTKFNYENKVSDYRWRIPVGNMQATHNEGLKSDKTDDKANYIYGTKDLHYLTSVETKNYIAVFSLSDREDGYGVVDKNGRLANIKPMKKLDKITLYAKEDYVRNGINAIEIKTVNFEYDYSLCPGITNNSGKSVIVNGVNINANKGKLTLKKIYFTYQKSKKAKFSPYQFTYSTTNPSYNIKAYDRWGNFKPNLTNGLYASEYPYVEQNKANADLYAQAWSLTEVNLPSGGKIKVTYESDDYAYVQNKRAGQMFKVVGVSNAKDTDPAPTSLTADLVGTPKNITQTDNTRLIIQLQTPITVGTQAQKSATFQKDYLEGLDYIYFRFLMRMKDPDKNEYVSGYLTKNNFDIAKCFVDPTGTYGCIYVKKVDFSDGTSADINPITKAALQFGRLQMSREVWSTFTIDDSEGFGEKMLKSFLESSFAKNIKDAIMGPNKALYNSPYNIARNGIMGKSWIRLNNPNKAKLGGGVRVKKIEITDQWDGTKVDPSLANSFSYGQEYTYTLEDGTSSGVASYEPQLGGDENSFKIPVFFSESKLLTADDEHYMEEPFGESFFPNPVVGYSKVTVKNLQRDNVTRHATGKTVSEFYTAKDFPTIVENTHLNAIRKKNHPFSLATLFKLEVKDYMTASQGFLIETNDMHGKPKMNLIYQEGQSSPISSIEYKYKKQSLGNGSFKLDNTATVVNSNGTIDNNATIGMFMDFVADMRETKNSTFSPTLQFNTDGFIVPPLPWVIPLFLPSLSREATEYRSVATTKLVQRFGILEETEAIDLGSKVSTKNLAYDAETGDLLLTETITDFNNYVYSFNYPAYWYYNGMGPAYQNIGYEKAGLSFGDDGIATVNGALLYFAEGDELSIVSPGNASYPYKRAWVKTVGADMIEIMDENGYPLKGDFVKIIRSGRRNQQGLPMATIVTMNNPLSSLSNNIYSKVLQAQAIEYTNSWKTYCDCYKSGLGVTTSNSYLLGIKGMYKPKKEYTYLSGRTQSNYNNNTDIQRDGVFTYYRPFYKMNNNKWELDGSEWTYTSEVTEYSPYGAELENKDALNRYSAALYGYNQSLVVSVANNTKYRNIGYENFEDHQIKSCSDNHFKFNVPTSPDATSFSSGSDGGTRAKTNNANVRAQSDPVILSDYAHSGKYSLKVTAGSPVIMDKQLKACNRDGCDVLIIKNESLSTPELFCYEIIDGDAPYQLDWELTGGDTKVAIAESGDKLYVHKSETGKLKITVTDKNNCKRTITINLSNGNQ